MAGAPGGGHMCGVYSCEGSGGRLGEGGILPILRRWQSPGHRCPCHRRRRTAAATAFACSQAGQGSRRPAGRGTQPFCCSCWGLAGGGSVGARACACVWCGMCVCGGSAARSVRDGEWQAGRCVAADMGRQRTNTQAEPWMRSAASAKLKTSFVPSNAKSRSTICSGETGHVVSVNG